MLHVSTAFTYLLDKYLKHDNKVVLYTTLKDYELRIKQRIKLDAININNYNSALENALMHIEFSDQILAWAQHLKLRIKMSKSILKKELELKRIQLTNEVEKDERLNEIKTKTEKKEKIAFWLKEKLIQTEQEYSEAVLDAEIIDTFVEEAVNLRESRYAYYQAIKNIKLDAQEGL